MIISAINGASLLDRERVAAVAEREFGDGSSVLYPDTKAPVEYSVAVEPAGESPFSVRKLRGAGLSVDGTETQDCRFASALRAALPHDFVRVVAIDPAAGAYVDLVPGITADDIRSGWRPVDEGGFE